MSQKLLLALFTLNLQIAATAQMSYGIKAGFVHSTLGETPAVYEYSGKNGFQAGLIASFPLTKDFFLQPALLYTQKCGKEWIFHQLFFLPLR